VQLQGGAQQMWCGQLVFGWYISAPLQAVACFAEKIEPPFLQLFISFWIFNARSILITCAINLAVSDNDQILENGKSCFEDGEGPFFGLTKISVSQQILRQQWAECLYWNDVRIYRTKLDRQTEKKGMTKVTYTNDHLIDMNEGCSICMKYRLHPARSHASGRGADFAKLGSPTGIQRNNGALSL
jgi:hypothetical protein